MINVRQLSSSVAPLAIIAGLLYAGLFVKPAVPVSNIEAAVIGQRDTFYGIAAPAPQTLWAVGRDGKVVRSEDAGRQWKLQATGSAENLQAIAAWTANEAVVVGNASTVLTTADGGAHWKTVTGVPSQSEARKLIRVRLGTAGLARAVGEFGTVLASADKGATWQALGKSEDIAWHDIAEPSAQTLVIVGEFGRIRRSTDAGQSWSEVTSPVKTTLTAVGFRDASEGIAVGLDGVVLSTADGGKSWHSEASPTKDHLFDLARQGSGWVAVGDKGALLRGDADGRWSGARISPTSYAWHTQVLPVDGSLYLAGAQLARRDLDQTLTRF
nr:YCF48-related protein [uncultured Roseateles sp.]